MDQQSTQIHGLPQTPYIHPFGVPWNRVNYNSSRVDISPFATINISATYGVCLLHICAVSSPWPNIFQHISRMSPTTKVRSNLGNTTSDSANLLPFPLTTVKLWRPAGHVTLSRIRLRFWPKVKCWRPTGHVTWSRLWLKCAPKVKLSRPAGHVTLSRLWSKCSPKVKLWRPAGHVTWSRLWLKCAPRVKLWSLAGHVTFFQALIEIRTKSQTLKACWPCLVV